MNGGKKSKGKLEKQQEIIIMLSVSLLTGGKPVKIAGGRNQMLMMTRRKLARLVEAYRHHCVQMTRPDRATTSRNSLAGEAKLEPTIKKVRTGQGGWRDGWRLERWLIG